jgi:hypothetical protein
MLIQEQWRVTCRGNAQYSIENVEHHRYADSGNRAVMKVHVEGSDEERLWRIQGFPTGEFTYVFYSYCSLTTSPSFYRRIATTDTNNFWMLPDDAPGTPVSTTPRNMPLHLR